MCSDTGHDPDVISAQQHAAAVMAITKLMDRTLIVYRFYENSSFNESCLRLLVDNNVVIHCDVTGYR